MCDFWVLVDVFFVFEGEVVHGVVLVEAAVLHALHHLHGVQVVLPVDDLHDSVLHHDVFTFEVDEMRVSGLIGQAELAGPQFP